MSRGNLNDVDLMRVATRDTQNFVAIGVASTGDDPEKDAIVALALADADGSIVFDQVVRPVDPDRWAGAKIVRGVHMDEAKNAPELREFAAELKRIVNGATVLVGYDLDVILQMLAAAGLDLNPAETFDLKHEFAAAHGRWSEWNKDYSFATLYELAARYGYATDDPRSAAEDARATVSAYTGFVGECRDTVRDEGGNLSAAPAKRVSLAKQVAKLVLLLVIVAVVIGAIVTGVRMISG